MRLWGFWLLRGGRLRNRLLEGPSRGLLLLGLLKGSHQAVQLSSRGDLGLQILQRLLCSILCRCSHCSNREKG